MSVIRPQVTAGLWRGREVIAAGVLLAAGLWLIWLGGYLLAPVGAVIAALAASWGMLAVRRMRFQQAVDAPGVVEVDEGQIGYFGPGDGGFVGLPDLVELRLIALRGHRFWRLKQADGQALLIPVDAAGAERLFDAFASLPGMDTQALVAALEPRGALPEGTTTLTRISDSSVIWRRAVRAVLT